MLSYFGGLSHLTLSTGASHSVSFLLSLMAHLLGKAFRITLPNSVLSGTRLRPSVGVSVVFHEPVPAASV